MPPKTNQIEAQKQRQKQYKLRRRSHIKNDPEKLEIEKQKRRAKYLRDKEEKKVKSINEKSARAQREQRKKWRENTKRFRQKKKEEKNTNDEVAIEAIHIEAVPNNEEGEDNAKINYENPLHIENQKFEAAIRKIRYRELKKRNRLVNIITHLRKQDKTRMREIERLKNVIKNIQKDSNLENTSSMPTIQTDQNDKNAQSKQNARNPTSVFEIVENFYLDDANSVQAAGKKEFITRNGIQKQKRYLCLPLKELYDKFLSQSRRRVSYSFFCKLRPYWVVFPRSVDRQTCQCTVHVNMELFIEALNRACVISQKSYDQVLCKLCCDSRNIDCLQRICNTCKSNCLEYRNLQCDVTYYEWKRVKKQITLSDGNKKNVVVTEKQKNKINSADAISKFQLDIKNFLNHTHKIVSQYNSIKKLKENLTIQEAFIHVDFSENYALKYATEVQSFHFGGSRNQVSLHTAVIYTHSFSTGQVVPTSMCTASDCLRHDAPAVWAHLVPLISQAIKLNEFIDTIHFLSDSPTSQYRNKYMFYIVTQLTQDFPQIAKITWNYSEAGHGKGAPDGIGATLKRTADRMVTYGKDIGTFNQFYDMITNYVENNQIKIIVKKVEENDVLLRESLIPKNLKPFRGTFLVYQIMWEKLQLKSVLRTMSCFSCGASEICVHGKHLGYLTNVPVLEKENVPLVPGKENVASEPDVKLLVETRSNTKPKSSRVKILSNVIINKTNLAKFTASSSKKKDHHN